jgi:hypothetical protein
LFSKKEKMMKVFKVDDATWMVGPNPESCIAKYLEDGHGDQELLDEFGPPQELSVKELAITEFYDVNTGETCSFQEQLDRVIREKEDFPTIFASTEY